MTKREELINELDVIDQFDLENFTELKVGFAVGAITPKAALISGDWFPKSQLRTDPDGNLWVSNWLYNKI